MKNVPTSGSSARSDVDNMQRSSAKNLFICLKHFEKKFIGKSSLKLLCGAYPTLFSPDEIISGHPIECEDEADVEMDHNYAREMHFDHTYPQKDIPSTSDAEMISNKALQSQDIQQPGYDYLPQYPTLARDVSPNAPDPTLLEEPSLPVLRIDVHSETPTLIGDNSASPIEHGIATKY